MSDLAFLDRPIDAAAQRRDRYERILRECYANKAKHLQNDGEQALDYCRDLLRGGNNVSAELAELETFANGLQLAVLLLKREAE